MIEQIIQMLQIAEFTGQSEAIEIAKGKYKIPNSIKEIRKQIKRARKCQ